MADLTDDQLTYLHDHLGASADEDDLQSRYDRLGTLDLVITEVLQRRLADLVSKPASFSVAGEYSQNTGPNIEALTKQLAQFEGGAIGGMSLVRIVAPAPPDPR